MTLKLSKNNRITIKDVNLYTERITRTQDCRVVDRGVQRIITMELNYSYTGFVS